MTGTSKRNGRPTMRQVAGEAGVSVQTVSNYINQRFEFMGDDTRARVAEAMQKLGYHPNFTARGLRSAATRTLGFLVLDEHARFLADPLTDLIVAGVGDVAREEGYGVLIQASTPSEDPDTLLKPVLESRVDGAFLLLSGDPDIRAEHCRRMAELTDKFLVFDEPLDDPRTMSVRAADREGGRLLGEHLIERGHERIGFIAARVPWPVIEQRFLGLHDALEAHGIKPDPELEAMEAGWEPGTAVEVAKRLLAVPRPPTAIICATDLLALATIHTARGLGLKVPADLAVAGFDDFPFAQFSSPPLTTVRVPAYEMGQIAARLLIASLAKNGSVPRAERQVERSVELLVRSST